MNFTRVNNSGTLAAVALVVIAAWLYLVAGPMPAGPGVGSAAGMPEMEMLTTTLDPWGLPQALLLFGMWAVMMVAMMLPAATPMLLLFSRISATRKSRGIRRTPSGFFAAGYLAVWVAFSVVAALVQWSVHALALLSPDMRAGNPIASAAILILAGAYQWLPVKQSCLDHCRSPLAFFTTSWREGRAGAVLMGMAHGLFCVGCCWMIMALLFVAGVMNLAWVAALSALVLLERFSPAGVMLARIAGVLFIAVAVSILLRT